MTARQKFIIGARVRESRVFPQARTRYVYENRPPTSTTGTVVGFGHDRMNPCGVRVRRDGQKATSVLTFHMDFWDVIEGRS